MNTLQDLHSTLRQYIGNTTDSMKSAAVVAAAKQAFDRIGVYSDWSYYQTWAKLNTSAAYSTGTIEYDETGGASERLVTLSGGTWPAWAASGGTLLINTTPYDVDVRLDNTTLQLKENQTPGADIAAGTTYTLYRSQYELPTNVQSIDKPIQSSSTRQIQPVPIAEFVIARNFNEGIGEPLQFALKTDEYGRNQLLLWPPPDAAYSLEYQYKRRPTIPTLAEEARGKIALAYLGSTAVGTGTAFTNAMIGCVLRVSWDEKVPTSYEGTHPYESEHVITSVPSPTTLNLLAAAAGTVAGRGYSISSRLDIDQGPMMTAITQMAMKNLRINLSKNMTNEEKENYERAMMEAKTYDSQRFKGRQTAQRTVAGRRGSFQRVDQE